MDPLTPHRIRELLEELAALRSFRPIEDPSCQYGNSSLIKKHDGKSVRV